MGKKEEEVHALVSTGEECEFELRNCMYFDDEGHLLKTVNFSPSLIPSIQKCYRDYNTQLRDDYIDRWGFANHKRDYPSSSESDNINIKQIILLSGTASNFPGIG